MSDPFDDIEYLDRTPLQRWDECPFMALAVERGDVKDGGQAAESGILAHAAIAEAIAEFVGTGGQHFDDITPEDVCFDGRPDVQQDAWQAIRPSLWSIKKLLRGYNVNSILRYQGGKGRRSGQLGVPMGGGVVATSEIDLLLAGETDVELEEIDWKTGRSPWTSTTVRQSFQFNFHAWQCFENYPDLELLHVRVWLTRFNQQTPRVTFTRKQATQFGYRVHKINMIRGEVLRGGEPEATPGEGCVYCPAAHLCPHAKWPAKDIAENPALFAIDTELAKKVIDARLKAQREYVKKNGPIALPDGRVYGMKPPSARQTFDYLGGR